MQNTSPSGFRLSPQQQQLFISQRGNLGAYSAQCAVLVEGKLDRQALVDALHKVVQRHEILRTTFQRRAGMKMPLQFIHDPLLPPLQEIDLSASRPSDQESTIEEYLRKDRSDPKSLEQSPLLRLALFTMSIERHVLAVSLPSLCVDGRSLSYLVPEIAYFYSPGSSTVTIADEPLQYADFSEWQNSILESDDEDAQSGKAYWGQQGLDAPPPMALCFAGKSDNSKEWAPDYCVLKLGSETASKVESLARASGASTERCLLAGWQALLCRLVGQSEVLVSLVPAERNHEEVVGALGLYARGLPIRLSLEIERNFTELVADVNKAVGAVFQWQDYLPVIENSSEVDPSHRPIEFEFDDRRGNYSAAGINFSIYRKYCDRERFNLKLVCIRAEDGLTLEFHFDASIFRAKDVERFAECFRQLLEQSISPSAGAIGTLDLLSQTDRQQLLVAFNQTATEYPQDKTLHQLFEEQVERTPNRVALVCGEAQLTYAQLNVQANQLAHYLRRLGVGANVCVGLCVERSAEMIIGLLGILKAGGAYLPLQPDNPKARLAHLLGETKAPLLLTQEKLLSQLPEFTGETVCFERVRTNLQGEAKTNPQSINSSGDLVYVIYTSGSTGTPKGVATRHRNLVNYATFIVNKLRSSGTATSEGLQFATVSTIGADLGNTCVFPALVSGGCLHVIPYDVAMDGKLFGSYVSLHPIDVLKITPSHLNSLLASQGGNALLPRKVLFLGGEASSWDLIQRIATGGSCKVINHYGPTETTVGSLTFDVGDANFESTRSLTVPIGRPIANTQVYLLDSRLAPVPIGVPGELFIGGAGVASGYLNQPEQTAERFVRNPFSTDPNARLYRTGDLARYLPDGNIEFLGRKDAQVKIRGFRIELGEVENAFRSLKGVRDVVAHVHADSDSTKTLVAYVVSEPDTHPNPSELLKAAREILPSPSVPSLIAFLPRLPLGPTGKVDRRALPPPERCA